VRGGPFAGAELPGGVDHHVDTERAPGDEGWIRLLQRPHRVVVHSKEIGGDLDAAMPQPVGRVVMQQVRDGLNGRQVVDCHDLECWLVAVDDAAQDVPADPAHPIDAHPRIRMICSDLWLTGQQPMVGALAPRTHGPGASTARAERPLVNPDLRDRGRAGLATDLGPELRAIGPWTGSPTPPDGRPRGA
jgi:hypothetical protein